MSKKRLPKPTNGQSGPLNDKREKKRLRKADQGLDPLQSGESTHSKKRKTEPNTLQALAPEDGRYPFLARPEFWKDAPPLGSAKKLYATILQLQRCDTTDCRPLVLITGKRLPIFQERSEIVLDVALAHGRKENDSRLRFIDGGKIKHWDGNVKDGLQWMGDTLGDLLAAKWAVKEGEAKWVVLPLKPDYVLPPVLDDAAGPSRLMGDKGKGKQKAVEAEPPTTARLEIKVRSKHIDWNEIARHKFSSSSAMTIDLSDTSNLVSSLMDTVFVSDIDDHSRTYRYVTAVHTELSLMSPDPREPGRTFLDSVSLVGDMFIKFPKQPIVETRILPRTSKAGWATAHPDKEEPESRFIIPELWQTYPSSSSVLKAATCIPAAMLALDDFMVALDLQKHHLPNFPDPNILLKAITSPARTGGDARRSYDRLEFVGDTILKLLTTIDVYLNPEGNLARRQDINSNRALRAGLIKSGIIPYIRSSYLVIAAWRPEGWDIASSTPAGRPMAGKDDDKQALGDKEIADIAEALIGAAYLGSNDSMGGAIRVLQFLGVPLEMFKDWGGVTTAIAKRKKESEGPKAKNNGHTTGTASENGGSASWMSAFAPSKPPTRVIGHTFQSVPSGISLKDSELSVRDGHEFEKFKTLGEAILDYCVVEDLCESLPDANANSLAKLKAARTNKRCQAALAVHLDLFNHLKQPSITADGKLDSFLKATRKARQAADRAGKEEPGAVTNWWEAMEMEKCRSTKGAILYQAFGDLLQATLGAITVNTVAELEEVLMLYRKEIKPFMDKYCGS